MAYGAIRVVFKPWANRNVVKALGDTVRDVGQRIEDEARRLCPVDTGLLKSTIKAKWQPTLLKYTVTADTPYAVFVHNGTRYMKARPFLAQAVDIVSRSM